jgi:hypothetical protein
MWIIINGHVLWGLMHFLSGQIQAEIFKWKCLFKYTTSLHFLQQQDDQDMAGKEVVNMEVGSFGCFL